jgi:FKBP-type peptidyl-prolyl cis-trans isomerase SlyD
MDSVRNDMVVSIDYRLHLGDNMVVDASEEGHPLTFVQGRGQIISGLEAAIEGMEVGQERDVVVAPADGYGELDADLYEELPRSIFPPDAQLGQSFRMRTEAGQPVVIYVDKIEGETVTVNLNHPMAGKTLHFHVQIAGLREATADELSGGCGHGCSSCGQGSSSCGQGSSSCGHSCGEDAENEGEDASCDEEEEECGCCGEPECGCSEDEDSA